MTTANTFWSSLIFSFPLPTVNTSRAKKGVDVLKALYYLQNRKRKIVISDRGIEFRSEEVNKYLQGQNIRHFYALNTEAEANDSERFIKTLKHKLFIYVVFTETTNR